MGNRSDVAIAVTQDGMDALQKSHPEVMRELLDTATLVSRKDGQTLIVLKYFKWDVPETVYGEITEDALETLSPDQFSFVQVDHDNNEVIAFGELSDVFEIEGEVKTVLHFIA